MRRRLGQLVYVVWTRHDRPVRRDIDVATEGVVVVAAVVAEESGASHPVAGDGILLEDGAAPAPAADEYSPPVNFDIADGLVPCERLARWGADLLLHPVAVFALEDVHGLERQGHHTVLHRDRIAVGGIVNTVVVALAHLAHERPRRARAAVQPGAGDRYVVLTAFIGIRIVADSDCLVPVERHVAPEDVDTWRRRDPRRFLDDQRVGVYESGHAESGDADEESFHGETWKGF